jgi:hypothetical protein
MKIDSSTATGGVSGVIGLLSAGSLKRQLPLMVAEHAKEQQATFIPTSHMIIFLLENL